jgi:hypothetical protein
MTLWLYFSVGRSNDEATVKLGWVEGTPQPDLFCPTIRVPLRAVAIRRLDPEILPAVPLT